MDAQLTICKEEIGPAAQNAIHRALLKKNWMLSYPITTTKLYNLSANSFQFYATNIFQDKIPGFILIYFVKAIVYTGDYQENPFYFSNMTLSKKLL